MIVLMDIGNTRIKYCLVKNGQRSKPKAITSTLLSDEFLTEKFSEASKVLVASVSHAKLTANIRHWCQHHKVIYQQVVSETKKNNVISAYENPSQLGVDRWLTLVGVAILLPKKSILIIDVGTASTFDLLAASGQHKGGWILAGVNMLITSLLANTMQVHANEEEQESIAFGVNTSENVHHGAWAATVGAVNMAIVQSEQQGLVIDEIVLTGGNSHKLSALLPQKHLVIEDLVFIGLQSYQEG